jgi:hypothetical protein
VVLFLAIAALEWTAPEREEALARRAQIGVRLFGVGVILALTLLGGGLNPALLVVLISLTFAAQVGIDVAGRLRQGGAPQASREASLG